MHVCAVGALGTLGVPGPVQPGCLQGECCEASAHDLQAAFPADVGFVSIYSKQRRRRALALCLDDGRGAGRGQRRATSAWPCNPGAYRAIAAALERFRREDRARRAAKRRRPPARVAYVWSGGRRAARAGGFSFAHSMIFFDRLIASPSSVTSTGTTLLPVSSLGLLAALGVVERPSGRSPSPYDLMSSGSWPASLSAS